MTTARRSVTLRGLADPATVRLATYAGREHLVVPVVMLVGDIVVEPMGSSGPEFVPADVLALAPGSWDGRPVLENHPTEPDGSPASANAPGTLEQLAYGQVFNARFEGGRLKGEAWIDPARAGAVGADYVVEAARGQKMVEVSVGAFVLVEKRSGQAADGSRYEHAWVGVIPDHLAVGLGHKLGACSIADGCGAPRAAARAQLRAAQEGEAMEKRGKGLLRRLTELLGFRSAAADNGTGNSELEGLLWAALRDSEPAFDGLAEVYQEAGKVVYVTTREGQVQWWERGFSLSDDGQVKLKDNAVEVRPTTTFEQVAAEQATEAQPVAEPVASEAPCGCGGNKVLQNGDGGDLGDQKGEQQMKTKQQLVEQLVACKRSPFDETDRATLESMADAKLQALTEAYAEQPATPPAAEPTPPAETKPATATEPTVDEFLAGAPEPIRATLQRSLDREARHRAGLIAALVGAQKAFPEAALKAKPTEELEALSSMLSLSDDDEDGEAVDFSGASPEPRSASSEVAAAPKPYTLGLAALAASTKGSGQGAN